MVELTDKINANFEIGLKGDGVEEKLQWLQNALQKAGSPIEKLLASAFICYPLTRPVSQHPVGRYKLDFAFSDVLLAVEIDGEKYHASKEARARDNERDRKLFSLGWKVLRFTGSQIWNDSILCAGQIEQAYIQALNTTAPPTADEPFDSLYKSITNLIKKHLLNPEEKAIEPILQALSTIRYTLTAVIEDLAEDETLKEIDLYAFENKCVKDFLGAMTEWNENHWEPAFEKDLERNQPFDIMTKEEVDIWLSDDSMPERLRT